MEMRRWIWQAVSREDRFSVVVITDDWISEVVGEMQFDPTADRGDVDFLRVQFEAVKNHHEALGVSSADRDRYGLRGSGVALGDFEADPALQPTGEQDRGDRNPRSNRLVQQILDVVGETSGKAGEVSSSQRAGQS